MNRKKTHICLFVLCLFLMAIVSTQLTTNSYIEEVGKLQQDRDTVAISSQAFEENTFSSVQEDENFNDTFLRFNDVFLKGCGRMKNRLLKTTNGDFYCARYRDNFHQIQGEHVSSILANIIGIHNVPRTYAIKFKTTSLMWKDISAKLLNSGWQQNSFVILTKYIFNLQPVELPSFIRHQIKVDYNSTLNKSEIQNFKTWADLLVLDYLTGNIDRIVGHYFNLQWDRDALKYPAHNTMTDTNGFLVFLDNESGFQHSYSLLSKYQTFHYRILKLTCVFFESTIRSIKQLQENNFLIEDLINRKLSENLTHFRLSQEIASILKERISDVYQHIKNCA